MYFYLICIWHRLVWVSIVNQPQRYRGNSGSFYTTCRTIKRCQGKINQRNFSRFYENKAPRRAHLLPCVWACCGISWLRVEASITDLEKKKKKPIPSFGSALWAVFSVDIVTPEIISYLCCARRVTRDRTSIFSVLHSIQTMQRTGVSFNHTLK